jgi:hypothetical protein
MDIYLTSLNRTLADFIKMCSRFQLSEHSKSAIDQGKVIIHDGASIIKTLKCHMKSLENTLSDCQYFIKEIEDDLSCKPPTEDFVYQTNKGMLSYIGRDQIIKEKKKYKPKKKKSEPPILKMERVLIPEIGYYMKLPKITALDHIPPMFYYYDNPDDKKNKSGIYCSLIPGIQILVPFPTIVDSTKEYGRSCSIKCKYHSRVLCNDQRNKMAKHHDSSLRICNFAHSGEKIVKIGYPSRCSTIPRFGDSASLTTDVKTITFPDIKNILLYGLNDLISSAVWFECNRITNAVYTDIDYV